MPFELHGRDEENVPIFTGAPETHSNGAWLFTIGVGVLLVAGFVLAGVHALAVQHSLLRFVLSLAVGGLLTGSVVIGSVWWYRLTREIPHLATIDELGRRFQVESDSLRAHARRAGIRPRLKVNGDELYRPGDFGDKASLLRPSSGSSADSHRILRTVDSASSALPRPAFAPESDAVRNISIEEQRSS